jgi:hypothetical protein
MTNTLLSSDTQTSDRPFPLRMARYAVQQGREPTSALASQLVILRAMGKTSQSLEELKGDWMALDYLHQPIGNLTLGGTLGLDAVLRKYGVETESYNHFADLGLEAPHTPDALEWLVQRVEAQRGVIVQVETDELPTLAALYGDSDHWPDAGCALLVIGVMRDYRSGAVLSYLVIDPLLGAHIRNHGPITIPAPEFEAAWQYRGCAAVATIDPARRSAAKAVPRG